MKLALIWAMANNRTIGRNNDLPWRLPEDLKYFKRTTLGKPIIMGRKTWDSIGKPLPGRTSIVISRDPTFTLAGAKVAGTLQAAIELAKAEVSDEENEEAMVIGGAEIFALALPMADRLYLTQVHADVEGDVFFPDFDTNAWREIAREKFSASDANPYDYSFIVLDRK